MSTSKKLSELFTNLESEVGVEDAVRFSVRLMDEDEVPSEVKEKVVSQNTSSIPTEAVEMMKHLPQELCDNFERLWNNQHKRNIKIPPTTDRVTRSMTKIGNVKALIVKSTRLKVKDVLKTQHSAKWIEAINIEIDSLINNFNVLFLRKSIMEKIMTVYMLPLTSR